MTERLELYKCSVCSNVVEVTNEGVGVLVCCGQNMELLNENIAEQIEYELPISYTVGNDSLKIHWQGVLLEQGEDGNYLEVGEQGQASNKVKFGWDLEAGETLIIEVRGDTNE